MPTRRPLKEMIPDIIAHFNAYRDDLIFNQRVNRIMEGQLRKEVEDSLDREVISPAANKRIKERIPSINVLKKATDKLSKVYSEQPKRMTDDSRDQEILENIESSININKIMNDANRIFNSQYRFALEPFVDAGKQRIRVLTAEQFLPFSDSLIDPNKMTVFIKLLGVEAKVREKAVDQNGFSQSDKTEIYDVDLLQLYSDDEILIIDTDGDIRFDKMQEFGINGINRFGVIPVLYKSKSSTKLIPSPNQEGLDMSILIPKLLSDLNYAVQFMSHSIIWTKNANLEGQEINPDTIVDLGDGNIESGDPSIGIITPTVVINDILGLTEYQQSTWFSSLGIKIQGGGRDASALSKAIDDADTTDIIKAQQMFFKEVEKDLFLLLKRMQDVWASANIVKENRVFTANFIDTFRIAYPETRIIKTLKQKIEEAQLLRDQNLMTRKQALISIFPDMTDKQLNDWLAELDKEKEQNMENILMGIQSNTAERKADGTFNQDNQVGGNQNPMSKSDKLVK